jgi:hypothetical protein
MEQKVALYSDWKVFFNQKITASGDFFLREHSKKEKTEIETYSSNIPGFKTSIEIGYESQHRILFFHILNPFTPLLNRQQKGHHLDRNEFYPHFDQIGKGLEFDEFNLRGMDEYLSKGLDGTETTYFRNGKLVKSILKTNSLPWTAGTLTFHFEKTISPRAEDGKPAEKEIYDQIVEIDLHEIYPGTDHANKGPGTGLGAFYLKDHYI